MPQTGRMSADELVPGAATSRGARIEPIILEDVPDRAFGYRPNPQLPEFAHNPGIAPGIFFGQLDDQLADLLNSAPPSALRNWNPLPSGPFVLSNPAQKGTRCDNGDELIDGFAELGSESQQPLSLLGRISDTRWELAPQDFILNLQVADLPSQFLLGTAGNHEQKRAKYRGHGIGLSESQTVVWQ